MRPFDVEVGDLWHDLGAQIDLDDDITLPDIQYGDTHFEFAAPARLNAAVTNAGDGLVLHGTVTAELRTECVRCLEPFVLTVRAPLDGLYTTAEKAQELPDDQEWYPLGPEVIDIAPAVESALRLELPFAPLHAEDCAGICPVCGCNRNLESCSCETQTSVPGPFDALKSLLEDDSVGS